MRLPADVRAHLEANEWRHRTHFRERMCGVRTMFTIPLQPPSGEAGRSDVAKFREFLHSWQHPALAPHVTRETRSLRGFGQVEVPTHFQLNSTLEIAKFLGADALARLVDLQLRFTPFQECGEPIYAAARWMVHWIEGLEVETCRVLARAAKQMTPNMGEGLYLRALPLLGIDTKLVERHEALLGKLLDRAHSGQVMAAGGLLAWLGCHSKGIDRILIRPLSPTLRRSLWGLDRTAVTSSALEQLNTPAGRVLLVENDVSGLTLPDLDDTVAIIGCGNNLAWLASGCLAGKDVAYWGDLDSWGFRLLAQARSYLPSLKSLLMDAETWDTHRDSVVEEPESCTRPPTGLNAAEASLFDRISPHGEAGQRLEQERLTFDAVTRALLSWRV